MVRNAMIEIKNVTKTYTKGATTINALDNISISAAKGEFVVVKGSSGCGKTTLLLVAGGLLQPDSGTVKINDQEINELSPDNMAEFRAVNIGFVFTISPDSIFIYSRKCKYSISCASIQ